MNDAMAEYNGVWLRPLALKAVRTLTRPVNMIGENPEREFCLVAPPSVEGRVLVVTEVTNKYNADNSKNDPVVDAEDWLLMMNVYMMEYDNHMRNERQWKV